MANTQIIFDPAEAEKFARDLARFNADLEKETKTIFARFKKLGETWQDAEHKKFEHAFDEEFKRLERFARDADEYVKWLHHKVRSVDGYHR